MNLFVHQLCSVIRQQEQRVSLKERVPRKFGQLLRLCIPDQFFSIYSCEKTNNAEYRTSSVLILRACKKSFNRRKDLHCVPLVDVVDALVLPLSPARPPAATHGAQPKPLFTLRNHSELYIWFLLPPSRVLSIVCKSSNQHAQILFNFTASRVALISSSHLDCLLFKSNGWVL